jgi:8-oxo-dGTP diphosphatase
MVDAPCLPQGKGLLHVVGAAILDGRGRCLVARRAPHVPHPGCWEFPGGKVEDGEDPRRALEREIAEELSLEIAAGDFLGRGEVTLGDGRLLVLDVYVAAMAVAGREARPTDHDELRWLAAGELDSVCFAAADVPVLPALSARLSGPGSRC